MRMRARESVPDNGPMPAPLTLQFALRLQALNRQGLTIPAIARQLRTSEADVMEAHRLLAMPVNHTQEPPRVRSDAERAAALERMPKRMQDRLRRA